jgi:homopolymeric O-antigen transport system ATP-binding protein
VRLGFAVAANVEPEVLLVDEVLSVGDEVFQRRCMEKIEDFRRDGRTIVFVSHGLSQVKQICEDAAWIDKGALRMIGPAAEVISEYQGTSHDATRIEGEQGARWGSGEGQIVGVTLLDGQGQPGSVMSTLEPMTIRVELTAHVPLQDVVVGVAIDSLSGVPVWGSNTRRTGHLIARLDGPATVTLTIPSLPLLEGVYDLTVALSDHTEVHHFDWWDKRIRFEVRQYRVYDAGLVHVPGTWSVTGAKAMLETNR